MLDVKKLLTKMLNRMATYKTLFTNHQFKATTTSWEYIGKTITVPTGHIYLVLLMVGWASGRPIGIGLNAASTIGAPGFPERGYIENTNGVYWSPTFFLTAGTYYVFCKRATVPTANNPHHAYAIDIPI